MPQARQTGEFNTFVGGLITEASPLTFPENASLDEKNFVLDRNGSRRRRLGMDRESGLTPYNVSYLLPPVGDITVNVFEWRDVAGINGKSFLVCQVHDQMYIVDRADESLQSSSYVKERYTLLATFFDYPRATFAAIDGKLVVAYGNSTVRVFTYTESTDSFSTEEQSIKIRDLFGVEDIFDSKDLTSPEFVNFRPDTGSTVVDAHMYNLRNQGWGVPRLEWEDTTPGSPVKTDPIRAFEDKGGDDRGLPSNADTPILNIYANVDETDKNSDRFNDEAAARDEPARTRAAMGHFIIDLLDRGASRKEQYEQLTDTSGTYANANPGSTPSYVSFDTPTILLPADITPGGVKIVAEFAGRVWYAGFSSEVSNGDNQSPSLASYVFYSQQVKHSAQIARCYQEGDPTDKEAPDVLDTDGGFVRVSGAYNIQSLVNVGTGLMVLAENGVWFISGSDSGTFNANNQTVTKITERGTTSPGSVVVVDNTIMYWADDAIYHISPDQFGSMSAKEISVNIRTFFQDIGDSSRAKANGIYDSYSKKVRWVYDTAPSTSGAKELVFDIVLGAFYPSEIGNLATSQVPIIPVPVSPYSLSSEAIEVIADEDEVLSDADEVVASIPGVFGGYREVAYLTLINQENVVETSLTFSTYSNGDFKDWSSVDGTGVDAAAYLLTGYIGTGDYHRFKQVPYVYFHLLRTESGFLDGDNDLTVVGESSCKVRSQWDWANSAAAGKWGKEFQAYRYRRMYMPDDSSDDFDSGHRTIVTKNKLRGRGRVVSLLISSEEEKDLRLLGWSMNIASNQSV